MTPYRAIAKVGWSRRRFLAAAGAMATGGAVLSPLEAREKTEDDWVDVNASIGQWPLRRLPLDAPDRLAAKLRQLGASQAWIGTLEGILSKDIPAANQRLAAVCRQHTAFHWVPFGSINPALPSWERELDRCKHTHRMGGIRLHPSYHGYALNDSRFHALLAKAAHLQLIVQIVWIMEDERMMHPRLRVDPVDITPLMDAIRATPGLRLVILNGLRTLKGPQLLKLMAAGNVSIDIAMLEGVAGLETLLGQVPSNRLLMGTHAPLFYPESTALKLKESELPAQARRHLLRENARQLLRFSNTPAPG